MVEYVRDCHGTILGCHMSLSDKLTLSEGQPLPLPVSKEGGAECIMKLHPL